MNSHGIGWGEPYDDNRAGIFYDLCDDFNLSILNTGEVTRISSSGRHSRLDLSLCSGSLSLDCRWKVIDDPHGSDHLPIITSIKCNYDRSERSINVPFDLTRNIDWQKFASAVSIGIESTNVLPPLEEYRFLTELIHKSALEAQKRPVPSTSFRRKPATPGWDDECTKLYLEKSDAFKAYRKHERSDLFEEYLKLERKLKNLIKAKKRSYWRRFVEGLSRETSMTTLWKVARNMRNRSSHNESEEYSNRWIFDFAKKVCPDSVPAQPILREPASNIGSPDGPFTMLELSMSLLSSNNSAPGSDMIKFNLLKNLPDIAKRRLLNLYNTFMEHNIVPPEWRQVKVIAIQKPGKPASDHNSYRPISMLSCMRKLLEKMILARIDHWVESNNLLSDTQFGFRKSKGTNDCLALLSSDIQLAFAHKEQLASVFLDIKGAFDSVSIEILSDNLHSSGLPVFLNNFLYNLLSEKRMNFALGTLSTSRNSYMGLPQGSCLSPLLYNFYVRNIDNCLEGQCTLRQLADDAVVSLRGPRAEVLQRPLQNSLDNLTIWARKLGIEFAPQKTQLVVFSRKRRPAQVKLTLLDNHNPTIINQSLNSKYLGVWFDSKCTWNTHIKYLKQKCQQRINFLQSITGTWWGAHPEDLIKLYKTTIRSVLEYGSFCFLSAADCHLIKLERIQYRCLRIALGCMHSTHNMSLEVLAGLAPLQNRFWELSLRILVKCGKSNTLVIDNFENMLELYGQSGSRSRFMRIYHYYMSSDICLPFYNPPRVHFTNGSSSIEYDLSMKHAIQGIPDHLRHISIPHIFNEKFEHVNCNKRYFTDGSRINGSTGFGVFNENSTTFRKLQEPCSVYVAELAAINFALGMISNMPADHYFIFSDSLSSIEALRSMKPVKHTSYFLTKVREQMCDLVERSYKITFVWVPSHCSIFGNEKADSLAKVGAQEGEIYDRQISENEIFPLIRQSTILSWQTDWSNNQLGRWLHSIVPNVSLRAWFKGLDLSRGFIRVMSRLMSNHYALNAHLYRINLVDSNICRCGTGYDDIDHVVWYCPENHASRDRLMDTLEARGKQPFSAIRDVLGNRDLVYMQAIFDFLRLADIRI